MAYTVSHILSSDIVPDIIYLYQPSKEWPILFDIVVIAISFASAAFLWMSQVNHWMLIASVTATAGGVVLLVDFTTYLIIRLNNPVDRSIKKYQQGLEEAQKKSDKALKTLEQKLNEDKRPNPLVDDLKTTQSKIRQAMNECCEAYEEGVGGIFITEFDKPLESFLKDTDLTEKDWTAETRGEVQAAWSDYYVSFKEEIRKDAGFFFKAMDSLFGNRLC